MNILQIKFQSVIYQRLNALYYKKMSLINDCFIYSLRHFGHLFHNSIKTTLTLFTSLYFQTLRLNWLNFFSHLKKRQSIIKTRNLA